MILKDLLSMERFQYLKVLNQTRDLSRTFITVESTETPDVAKYIPQNTLLLMTGMAFKDDPAQMCSFLEELDGRQCAGVAIKLGRFIDTLDQRVLDTADQLGLPLLRIPMDKTLGTVYQEVLSYIWNNKNDYLLGALNTQQKISNLILQGSSLKSIMNNLSAILDRPVMTVDLFGRILDHSFSFTRGAREKMVQAVSELAREGALEGERYCIYEMYGIRFCIYPVRGVARNTNYLVLLDFDPGEKEEQMLMMEQITMALELYFYKNLYVKYNEMKLREEFFTFFLEQLENKTLGEEQMLAFGNAYGFRQMPEYRVMILEMEHEEQKKFDHINFSKKEERYILTYDWMKHLLGDENQVLIFSQESSWRYVCLIQGSQPDYRYLFVHIHQMIKEKFQLEATVAQGGVVSSFLNIKNSLGEAEQCLTNGNRDKDYPFLLSYKPKNMMELFKFIPEREMKDICEATLKELAYPQNQMEEELRKTLSTFLFNSNSITKTAEILFVHRNTIKYRLKKCEEILDIDFSDESSCFQIQLALVLTEYAQ